MEQAAKKLLKSIRRNEIDNNTFSECLSDAIYDSCKTNYKRDSSSSKYSIIPLIHHTQFIITTLRTVLTKMEDYENTARVLENKEMNL